MSKSALRVLEIMEFIADKRDGCTHTAIAQGLNIPKSSLTALLQDLLSKGYLQRTPESGVFTIGVQVLWLSNSYLRNLNLVKLGQPLVAEIFAHVKEFSILAIPNGTEYVTICTESVPSIFGHTLQLGSRGPLFCSALGKAMLAYMPAKQVDDILKTGPRIKATQNTKTSLTEIRASLEETRNRGYAVSFEEALPGVVGFATPVFGATGLPVAAFGVGVATSQYKESTAPSIVKTLKAASQQLSRQLGWVAPVAA
ncbi:IclR family transcriptional regulator [Paraburkholderia sp. SIMBA_049]